MSKEISKWADKAMFKAEEIDRAAGPQVFLLDAPSDPLGNIAAAAKAYKGEFVSSLAEITDEERHYYLEQVQKSVLEMPLESVSFMFRITGVTRGFTHQMVRQRTAAYSQESTRFAVKETVPVGLPPSLAGTIHRAEWRSLQADGRGDMPEEEWLKYEEKWATPGQRQRFQWDTACDVTEKVYNTLVDTGMPAEDARGLLPTNLLTQINYITDLRGLKGHAGLRLCTQAQFEWRLVWAQIVKAIRDYGIWQHYWRPYENMDIRLELGEPDLSDDGKSILVPSAWQFDALADIFKPICYYRGSCQFGADFDRACSIRGRVDANAEIGRPSTEWDKEHDAVDEGELVVGFSGRQIVRTPLGIPAFIPAIHPSEWLLDAGAARVK